MTWNRLTQVGTPLFVGIGACQACATTVVEHMYGHTYVQGSRAAYPTICAPLHAAFSGSSSL